MNPSVRSKVLASLLLIILVMAVHQILSAHVLLSLERRSATTLEQVLQQSQLLDQLLGEARDMHANAALLILATDQSHTQQLESEMLQSKQQAEQLLARLAEVSHTPETLEKLTALRFAWDGYVGIVSQLVLPVSEADREAVQSLLAPEGAADAAAVSALRHLEEWQATTQESLQRVVLSASRERETTARILTALTAAAAFLGLAFALRFASQTGTAVKAVQNAARLLAQGDLDWRVTVETGDELQMVAESLTLLAREVKSGQAASRESAEQLRTEMAECRRLERLLTAEKNRFMTTVDMIVEGVVVTDPQCNVVHLNQRAVDLTGWRSEQVAGRPLREILQILNRITRSPCPCPAETALQSRRIVRGVDCRLLLARDGTEHAISYGSAPVLDKENQIVGALVVFREEAEP